MGRDAGLEGFPAKFVTIARRRGNEWFLGSMTNWDARDVDLPLTFLGAGSYRAEIYSDAPDADQQPKHVAVTTQTVDRNARLKAHLTSGGGYAVRFVPIQK